MPGRAGTISTFDRPSDPRLLPRCFFVLDGKTIRRRSKDAQRRRWRAPTEEDRLLDAARTEAECRTIADVKPAWPCHNATARAKAMQEHNVSSLRNLYFAAGEPLNPESLRACPFAPADFDEFAAIRHELNYSALECEPTQGGGGGQAPRHGCCFSYNEVVMGSWDALKFTRASAEELPLTAFVEVVSTIEHNASQHDGHPKCSLLPADQSDCCSSAKDETVRRGYDALIRETVARDCAMLPATGTDASRRGLVRLLCPSARRAASSFFNVTGRAVPLVQLDLDRVVRGDLDPFVCPSASPQL